MTQSVRMVELCGRQMRVAVREGDGVPLLLCNGIGASLEALQPFVDALDESVPVIRFDAPGVGGSELPSAPYNLALLAHQLGKLLDELGVDQVNVLGISWGGGLAQQFALQNPRRCLRLVLVSTATGALMVPANPSVLRRMATPRRHRDSDYAMSIAGMIYGGRMREEPQLARQILDGHAPMGARRGYVLQLLAAAGWTSLPALPLIRQQTLLLMGDDDPIIPLVNGRIMQRLLPHARLHVFHDGHLGLMTLADDLAPRVAHFLQEGVHAAAAG